MAYRNHRPHSPALSSRPARDPAARAGHSPIDIGIAMTIYGQDALGNPVEIESSRPPACGTPLPGWQDDAARQ